MTKRIGKVEQFEFGSLSNGKHLHMVLAISGFCGNDDDEGKSLFDLSCQKLCLTDYKIYLALMPYNATQNLNVYRVSRII